MASEAFGETLQFITTVKLQEVEKRSDAYAEALEADPIKKPSVLVRGMRSWPGAWSSNFKLDDVGRWLEQARRNPIFPQSSLPNWIAQAKEQFAHKGTRFEFAKLFSNLVFDRVRSMPQGAATTPVAGLDAMEAEASGQDGFDKVSRKETLQQEKLESIIFEAKEIDVPALEEYLEDLYSSKDAREALSTMRSRICYFANSLRSKDIKADDVKQCHQLSPPDGCSFRQEADTPQAVREEPGCRAGACKHVDDAVGVDPDVVLVV